MIAPNKHNKPPKSISKEIDLAHIITLFAGKQHTLEQIYAELPRACTIITKPTSDNDSLGMILSLDHRGYFQSTANAVCVYAGAAYSFFLVFPTDSGVTITNPQAV